MQTNVQPLPRAHAWGRAETLLAIWCGLGLLALAPAAAWLRASFPLFSVIWLAVPLATLAISRDAARAGFRAVPWRRLLPVAALNLGGLLLVALAVEPWSGAYRALVRAAVASAHPDPTFAWLVRFSGAPAWIGLALFSGLVTIFAEELFFRGWLLQLLLPKIGRWPAILVQALLFALPNALAAFLLPLLAGIVYGVAYAWLAVGVIGGWAAARTASIWPSLIAAVACNLFLTALLL